MICLFFGLYLTACTHRDEAIAQSDVYRIPLSIENGRISLRYTMRPLSDTVFIELKRFVKDGMHYEQRTQYLKGQPMSEALFEIAPGTFRLVKEYTFQGGVKTPVAVLGQYNIDRQGHRGYESVTHSLLADFKIMKRTVREIFDKDMIFRWNGKDIASQRFYLESDEEVVDRLVPFFNKKKAGRGFLIYSEGMGNTYFKLNYDNIIIESALVSIEYPGGQ